MIENIWGLARHIIYNLKNMLGCYKYVLSHTQILSRSKSSGFQQPEQQRSTETEQRQPRCCCALNFFLFSSYMCFTWIAAQVVLV